MGVTDTGTALIVDVGTAWTKAALFDVVEGAHRFVSGGAAPTTVHGSHEDVSVGVRAAIARIELVTGRKLQGPGGPLAVDPADGSGVDIFTSTTSLGDQLRVLVLAENPSSRLVRDVKAAGEVHGTREAVLPIREEPRESGKSPATRPGAILASDALRKEVEGLRPHALVIVGSESAQPSPTLSAVLETVAKELRRGDGARPAVIFLGGEGDAANASRVLRDSFDLRVVGASHDVPSSTLIDLIGRQLVDLWEERIVGGIPGYSLVISWQNNHVVPTSNALCIGLSLLSQHQQRTVVGVDTGSSAICLARVDGDSQAIHVARGAGAGSGSPANLRQAIHDWLPDEMTGDNLANAVWNKWARPWSVPSTASESLLETAYAVAVMKQARQGIPAGVSLEASSNRALLVGSGGMFTRTGERPELVLALLDGIEPSGVFDIAFDRLSILPHIGALAMFDRQAALGLMLGDGPAVAASCIACNGEARQGSPAFRLELGRPAGLQGHRLEVPFGSVRRISLADTGRIEVELKGAANLDGGWGRGKGGRLEFPRGYPALVVDARGRPVRLPAEGTLGLEKRREWLATIGA